MRHPVSLILILFFMMRTSTEAQSFAIAIHGGAGVIPKTMADSVKTKYTKSLEAALSLGVKLLKEGKSGLDVVEAVIRQMEDDPLFNAGKGAVYTASGGHELDASVMDGQTLACGGVAGVTTVKNPISLARLVMEKTPHVLLTGPGAEAFAREMKVEIVDPKYFDDPYRFEQWQKSREKNKIQFDPSVEKKGTVGCVVRDTQGHLYAGTSTGGMTNKRAGRVGDSPLIGAGTYANRFCAVSCTGTGEQFIRHSIARDVAALMEYKNWTLQQCADHLTQNVLQPNDGGLIAVDKDGAIVFSFNSNGMFRGAADSGGRFEVKIWE